MSDAIERSDETPSGRSQRGHWSGLIVAALVAYVLSSGPVLALGCWLRDKTDWNGFYAVFALYLPLLYTVGDVDAFEAYIRWWMNLLDTMPPG